MSDNTHGMRIAFLATDGVEQIELTEPWQAVTSAGAQPRLVAPSSGSIQGFNHHDKGDMFGVDDEVAGVRSSDFDALVLPGGVISPDALRLDEAAMAFVRGFFDDGKPVAAICHGPWSLVETGVVRGRTVTSWPSLRTDIVNAGGTWVDEPVHVDQSLVTSRKPDDLPAFCDAILSW